MNDEQSNLTEQVAERLVDVVPQVMHVIRAKMRRHRASDLSLPQFRTLTFLHRQPGSPLAKVAEHVGLTAPSASKMIDRLVQHGLVLRQEAATDRRSIALTLTTEGEAALARSREATVEDLAAALAQLDASELRALQENLELMGHLFSPQEAPAVPAPDTALLPPKDP
jgi:MarR family transcriptional regulator for hemolysin